MAKRHKLVADVVFNFTDVMDPADALKEKSPIFFDHETQNDRLETQRSESFVLSLRHAFYFPGSTFCNGNLLSL